ncbi:serine/arginine repetitive matrix protein 1-like isoform X2 [Lingula anatina]|uniref:Serine/arginine repetitive matrix protein 1-like isoform X2 n=1 Tax=Lingula anatina TaxID=7574 RepID=A0A1S3II13_LINAN|nr:serine/arginine repetitive matrix protein 1-like isoform X2 [Lingula anatina]|eukprot:XP_013397880.1 serine/arginine repetitive matrix protein 1-like isoform X2 [Lingula anatina]
MAEVQIRSGQGIDPKNSEDLPEDGRVNRVRQEWLVHEDGALAHRMQEEEFEDHFGLNRKTRRTVREDIQVAKVVQTEEEFVQQRERMLQLERLQQRAREDEEVARKVHLSQVEKMKKAEEERRRHEAEDEGRALQLQMEEEERQMERLALDDERKARQLQFEIIEAEMKRREEGESQMRAIGKTDEDIARKLQEKEQRRYERYQEKKRLAKERKRLEEQIAQESREMSPTTGHTRDDGRREDSGDFSDFYIPPAPEMDADESKQLQELQDEELARLIQEQEHKRGASTNKEKLKQIEQQDEELARIIQEEERLKTRKVREKHRQASMQQPHSRQLSEEFRHPAAARSKSVPTGPSHDYRPDKPPAYRAPPLPERVSLDNSSPLEDARSPGRTRAPPPSMPPPPIPAGQRPRWELELAVTGAGAELENSRPSPPHHSPAPSSQHDSMPRMSPSPPPLPPFEDLDHQSDEFESQRSQSPPHEYPGGAINIAAALDPTYRRQRTPGSQPPPADNSLRDSTLINRRMVYPGAEAGYDGMYDDDDEGVMAVPGQRRGSERGSHSSKKNKSTKDKKNNCKQQ